jgi:hypothetical protein
MIVERPTIGPYALSILKVTSPGWGRALVSEAGRYL